MRILRSILFVLAVMLLVSIMAAHGQNTGTTGDPVATLKTGLIGGSDGTNLRSISVDSSGRLIVTSPSGSSSNQVQGTAAAGATPVGNPVQIGGSDGTNMQVLRTDTSGRQVAVGAAATGAAVVGSPVYIAGIDPSNLVRPIRVGSNGDVSNLQTFQSSNTSGIAAGNFLGLGTTGGGSGALQVGIWGVNGGGTYDVIRDQYFFRNVSATNTANTATLNVFNLHDTLAIHAACSASTGTLLVEVSADGSNFLTIDSIAAASPQIKQYTATTVGAGIALSPLSFATIRVTMGSCGVGNTSTLTIGVK